MPMKDWSTTAANNDTAGSVNFAEGQAPSTVNNSARQAMADVRAWYEDVEWRDWGHTPSYVSATSFTVTGDQTAVYLVGRRIRMTDATTLYGTIASVAHATVTTVTVTMDSGSMSASLTAVSIGFSPAQKSIPTAAINFPSLAINVSGFVRGRAVYVYDDTPQHPTIFTWSGAYPVDTWKSIGPTGSSPDYTWTALDLIPATAVAIIVSAHYYGDLTLAVDSFFTDYSGFQIRKNGSSASVGNATHLGMGYISLSTNGASVIFTSSYSSTFVGSKVIPISAARKFDMLKTGPNGHICELLLHGWIDSDI